MQSSKVGTIDKSLLEEAQKYSQHVVNGLNEAVTQFHAVNYCKERLAHAGYTEIREMYVLFFY
jgi:aspartyl aminopeptidase